MAKKTTSYTGTTRRKVKTKTGTKIVLVRAHANKINRKPRKK